MKTPRFEFIHRIVCPLLAAIFCAAASHASDQTYSTGSSAAAAILGVGDNEMIFISGNGGQIVVSSGTLTVGDLAQSDALFSIGNKENITFKSESYANDKWAALQGAGGAGMLHITAVTGTRTLALDRMIITNGGVLSNSGGGLRVAGAADTTLLVKGDVVFLDNAAEYHGGGIQSSNSVIFDGLVTIEGNKAGYLHSTGSFMSARHGGGYYSSVVSDLSQIIFKKKTLFASNTATASGGGMFADSGHSVQFVDSVTFRGNESGVLVGTSYAGGGLYLSAVTGTVASLVVDGGALFESNKTRNSGGGIYAGAGVALTFNGDAYFKDNTAGSFGADVYGGGLYLGAGGTLAVNGRLEVAGNKATQRGGGLYLLGSAVFGASSEDIVITGNFAGNITAGTDGAQGGGIYSSVAFSSARNYDISRNQSQGVGGAYYGKNLTLGGSGVISGNIATLDGGAIYLYGGGVPVRLYSGALVGNNMAGRDGGALYFENNGTLYLNALADDIIFRGNQAGATIIETGGSLAVTVAGTANAAHFTGTAGAVSITANAGQAVWFYDPISASGTTTMTVTKAGAGTVVFDQWHTGIIASTTVGAGEFRLTNGAAYGTAGTGTFTVANGGTLSGNGQINAATMVLNGNAGGDASASSTVEVLDGGELFLNRTAGTFNVRVLAGSGTIRTNTAQSYYVKRVRVGEAGATGARTLTISNGNLTFMANADLILDLYENNEADRVHVTGAAGVQTTGITRIDIGNNASGTFTLASWDGTGTLGTVTSATLLSNGIAGSDRASGTLEVTGNSLVLTNTAFSLDMTWTGSAEDRVWTDVSGQSDNWSDGGAVTEPFFRKGDNASFGANASGMVRVAAAGVTASQLMVGGGADYTFEGGGITITGSSAGTDTKITSGTSGKLIKAGAGLLAFTGTADNLFAGGVEISGGTVAFTRAGHLQTAAGGTIAISGTAALRADAAGSGTLAANLYIDAASAATLDTQGFALAHSGAIAGAGATGVLYKTGSGALTLFGDSPAFSGTFNINAGRVTLAGGANLGGAAVVASGAALGGASDSAGLDVAVRAGGLLEAGPGGGVTGTLALRSLALENGATLQFTLLDGGTGSRLTVAAPANATPASGTAYINLLAGFASDGMVNYNLGNLAALNGSLAVRVNDADADATARQNAELSTSADDLLLAFGTDKSRRMTWNLAPASGGVWDGGAPNWRDSGTDASVKNKFLAGDAMAFDGAFSGTVDIQPSGAAQVVVSELSINTTGAGTLSLTGSGIFASATTARNLGFAASGKLIKTGSGTLVLANDANYFEAGILINEGVIEYTHGAQLATSGTASVALGGDATLRAGADMTAPGAGLGGLLDLGAHTLTFDTAGHNAALSGTTLGPGTLVKTGDGWLELSGTAALGHAATRIDAGLIKLGAAVAADAAGVAHTFDLNGGWLDLSDTGTGAPGNEWAASLMLTGGTGRVIGGNDYITPGSGTHAYQIGGVADEDRGVYVIIENGAATLTGSNNYMGYTRINATGTLNVSADSQLGDTAVAREVILNGGLLRVTESFATARKIELRAGGTVSVAGGATTAWAGTTEAPGDSFIFTKDGAGTLVLGGALGHKGGTVVRSGTLAGDAGNFTGAVEALADGAVVFAQAATGTFSGTVSGAGVWRKTGAASPVFAAGARIATETVSIDEGVFTSARNDTFAGVRDFVIASGGTLAGSGTVAAALFTNRGAIIGPNPTRRLSTTSAAATAWSRRASRWSSDAASAFTARAHGASAARSRATASISG